MSSTAPPAILVDAVGTLIVPQPTAAETYCRIAQQHGLQRDVDRVAARLRAEISHNQQRAANLPTSPQAERQFWRGIVHESLELDDIVCEAVFAEVWDAFADPSCWVAVSDAVKSVIALRNRGVMVAIASNFDSRLNLLWSRWSALPQEVPIFTCESIGWRKPHPSFYHAIDERLPQGPRIMIGDELGSDVLAPAQVGWHSIWLSADAPQRRLPPKARRARDWPGVMKLLDQMILS